MNKCEKEMAQEFENGHKINVQNENPQYSFVNGFSENSGVLP